MDTTEGGGSVPKSSEPWVEPPGAALTTTHKEIRQGTTGLGRGGLLEVLKERRVPGNSEVELVELRVGRRGGAGKAEGLAEDCVGQKPGEDVNTSVYPRNLVVAMVGKETALSGWGKSDKAGGFKRVKDRALIMAAGSRDVQWRITM